MMLPLSIFPLAIVFLLAAFISCSNGALHPPQNYGRKLLGERQLWVHFEEKREEIQRRGRIPFPVPLCCCFFLQQTRQPSCCVKAIFLLDRVQSAGKALLRAVCFPFVSHLDSGKKTLNSKEEVPLFWPCFFLWREYVSYEAVVDS